MMTPQNWRGTVVKIGYTDTVQAESLNVPAASGPVYGPQPPHPQPPEPERITYQVPESSRGSQLFEQLRVLPVPRRRRSRVRRALVWTGVVVTICGAFAPHAVHEVVAPSSVHPIGGAACVDDQGVASAVITSDSGPYLVVRVQCADGVSTSVAQDK